MFHDVTLMQSLPFCIGKILIYNILPFLFFISYFLLNVVCEIGKSLILQNITHIKQNEKGCNLLLFYYINNK